MKKELPQHDYYAILGVPKSADLAQIKKAYRQLAQRHHPDRAGESGRIVLINEAYATLKDPKKRTEYDVYHAIYFGNVGKIASKFTQTISQTAQKSPTIMANLKKMERHASAFARFAEYELRPMLIKNAKNLFDKLGDVLTNYTPQTPNQAKQPTLSISPNIATHGGSVHFVYKEQQIRTTLPKGLTDGSHIKLTIDGTPVWFVVKVQYK